MKCKDCKWCRARPCKRFEDSERKVFFGLITEPCGKWVNSTELVCIVGPEIIEIEQRQNTPCARFEEEAAE